MTGAGSPFLERHRLRPIEAAWWLMALAFFFDFPEFRTKLLELLKEVIPAISNIGVIWDPNSGPAQLKSVEAGAAAMNLKLQKLEARNAGKPGSGRSALAQRDRSGDLRFHRQCNGRRGAFRRARYGRH